MDLLKKELERKKKTLQEAKEGARGTSRFLNAAALRRLADEKEDEERQKRRLEQQGLPFKKKLKHDDEHCNQTANEPIKNVSIKKPAAKATGDDHSSLKQDGGNLSSLDHLSPEDISIRLRAVGLPVRLFGERTFKEDGTWNDSARLERLGQALADKKMTLATMSEKEEFRLGQGHSIRNPFLDKRLQDESPAFAATGYAEQHEKAAKAAADEDNADDDDPNDPHKRIYKYLKGLLSEWEDDLVKRPENVKRSVAGNKETNTYKQCKDYIRPLFKLCKKRKLEEGLTNHLLKIVEFCQQGEFVKAHDAYMDVAIGRAAWPIGVTMVGIHARSGRAKIESSNVAHVMNSELQRKYLTSVKRLMTYAQNKRPDIDPSKKVIN